MKTLMIQLAFSSFLLVLFSPFFAAHSSAQDFDFFYFVQQWPGSYCDTRKSCCYPTTGKPEADFGIHGLWPNYKSGAYPSNCDPDSPYQSSTINDLIGSLRKEWPTLACPSSDGNQFWEHEWEKHGTCSESVLDQHSYFQATLDLKKKINLLQILNDAGIKPDGGYYSVSSIKDAINQATGFTPFIECNVDEARNRQLYQVYMCVDTSATNLIECPIFRDIGIELSLYDLKSSSSGNLVFCDEGFCSSTYGGEMPGCVHNVPCQYTVLYGDGSSTTGYFVTDHLQYNHVSGSHQTKTASASVTFGCGDQLSGDLGSSAEAVDGILGFGQSNSSMLSQLASAGKVRKIFSHCLDTKNGGGIFAIGHVVQPKVKTTPLVPDMPHYNVILKSIQVGGAFLKLPTDIFETGDNKGTILDSGTTLAYLPEQAFRTLMNAIFSYQPGLSFLTTQGFLCFKFSGRVDDGFPKITFHFEDSVELSIYPHDYLFSTGNNYWCTGFQNSALQSKDGKNMILLGDMVLANKLVVYDLENQVVGWTDYDCSSSIKIQDDMTSAFYTVDAHNLSSAGRLEIGGFIAFLMATYFIFNLFL